MTTLQFTLFAVLIFVAIALTIGGGVLLGWWHQRSTHQRQFETIARLNTPLSEEPVFDDSTPYLTSNDKE